MLAPFEPVYSLLVLVLVLFLFLFHFVSVFLCFLSVPLARLLLSVVTVLSDRVQHRGRGQGRQVGGDSQRYQGGGRHGGQADYHLCQQEEHVRENHARLEEGAPRPRPRPPPYHHHYHLPLYHLLPLRLSSSFSSTSSSSF